MKQARGFGILLSIFVFYGPYALADCQYILQPNAEYLAATGKCEMPGKLLSTTRDCEIDGEVVANFLNPVQVR